MSEQLPTLEERTKPTETPDPTSPEAEHNYHNYVGTRIPWYVHMIWILYWVGAIYYILVYQLPVIREDFLRAP